MIQPGEFVELVRKSSKVQLHDQIVKHKYQTQQFLKIQFDKLKLLYEQKTQKLFEDYEELKLKYMQLKLKNEQYAQLISEYECQQIKYSNNVGMQAINQILNQKIKSLLLLMKEKNIISEIEFQQQMQIGQNKNDIVPINDFLKLEQQIECTFTLGNIEEDNNNVSSNKKELNIRRNSTGTQANLSQKKYYRQQNPLMKSVRYENSNLSSERRNSNKFQNSFINQQELEQLKKSVTELQKSKVELQCYYEQQLKKQNKKQQNDYSQNDENIKQLQCTKVITKFLKFDDILLRKVSQFSAAQSFDLKQGIQSCRNNSARPKTSLPTYITKTRRQTFHSPSTTQACNI